MKIRKTICVLVAGIVLTIILGCAEDRKQIDVTESHSACTTKETYSGEIEKPTCEETIYKEVQEITAETETHNTVQKETTESVESISSETEPKQNVETVPITEIERTEQDNSASGVELPEEEF